jgi:AcrR family transcriptional regulator
MITTTGPSTNTREMILNHAMDIASSEGLEGLTIGRLAGVLKMSKSGLFAHFGSKEELQLATINAAREVFDWWRILSPGICNMGFLGSESRA